ncbi:LytTR family DNA-binding domain-containing protein [Magnetospirillum sulfuroxidans]|uniref:LytTR family transcriptional regulator n=1 Tax=Magnetospirillum sulfuroxidans TaxID=611300 RepID=A0ABS5I9J4_9PROT|nr:LytTR family DNA-binding domain-containing protein [Magnetospirillum sulfuroxidans]MBR9971102.1 LytTR family transcriptional regulator [Magnetospirillum sulfuroxidans]
MSSFEYRLQRIPQGVVVLDDLRRVISANRLARRMLETQGAGQGVAVLGTHILDLHPPMVRPKVQWLLDCALAQPDEPASMAMTLPVGTLVARVSVLDGAVGAGYCLVFHLVEALPQAPAEALLKLPLDSRHGVRLLDVALAAAFRAERHYSRILATDGSLHPCTMGFSELIDRLDPVTFLQVHRSWIVNLRRAKAVERVDGQWRIVLDVPGAEPVPVSRGKVESLRQRLAM